MKRRNVFKLFMILAVSIFLSTGCDQTLSEMSKKSVILVPGWAGTDAFMYDSVHYFWQLKEPMEAEGFTVNEPPLACFGTTAVRAKQLGAYIFLLLQKYINENNLSDPTGIKFNLIAHSHGGLVSRYLIRSISIPDPMQKLPGAPEYDYDNITFEMLDSLKDYMSDDLNIDGTDTVDLAPNVKKIPASDFVGNIAMLSTPNQGTYIAKWIVEDAGELITDLATWIFENVWAGVLAGQDNPEFEKATATMTEEYVCNFFNPTLLNEGRKTPDIKIFNYSYTVNGAQLNINAMMILPLWSINYLGKFKGGRFNDNDGVVMTESAAWTPTLEEQQGNSQWNYMGDNVGYNPDPTRLIKPGVDHWMLVNQFLNLENTTLGIDMTPDMDVPKLYIDIAKMLAEEATY